MAASTDKQDNVPRAIEVGFPIVEINRLAQPERNSFKPIYQMHNDLPHALIALADAGEPVLPLLERFPSSHAVLRAGCRFLRDERADWATAIDRVLAVIEGTPLFDRPGVA